MSAASSDDARGGSPADSLVSSTSETSLSFGKYRLTRLLARGGMGEVYLARLVGELGFEKRLVIKTILPHLAAKPRFVEMFAAEAKTAVALSHGNIVPIYELGRQGEILYIVMGHVDGPSVATILDEYRASERAPELGVALHIVRGVLTGLAYAHTPEPGRPAVVHRDITPRNVLVDRSGQVRIVDFGIAAQVDAEVDVRGGSTGYAAPEQIRGDNVDPRADVFSTACLLYELVTLERAFPKEGVWMMPDLDGVPTELRAPLKEALAIDPAGRPSDAHVFLDRLAPAFARHAAMFGDGQLAAHLRTLFPDGWDSHSQPAVAGAASKRKDRKGPATHTFATRLTLVTKPIAIAAAPARASSRAGRWPFAIFGAVAIAAIAWWGTRDRERPRPSTPEPATALADTHEPEPAKAAPAKAQPIKPEPISTQPEPVAEPVVTPSPTPAVDVPAKAPKPVPPKKGSGYLRALASSVVWAEVQVDGVKVGNTPLKDKKLSEGIHKVKIICTDACPERRTLWTETIEIEAGKTKIVRAPKK